MNASNFPWKNIGRDIGKKLRDVIKPPTDTGPTREERRAQRFADALKGFSYLDDFEELKAWTSADSSASQRANVPLLPRVPAVASDDGAPRSRLLLCHDYAGWHIEYVTDK